MSDKLLRRSAAQTFVKELNARTFCERCGAQPIEWHNPEHVELNREHFRIGKMAFRGEGIPLIKSEIQRCTPLCRRCHMTEDGRLERWLARAKNRPIQPPKPCTQCGRGYKPLRRGLCNRCDGVKRHVNLTPDQWAEMLKRRGLQHAANHYGISVEEYVRRKEAGERFCQRHKRWESGEMITPKGDKCPATNRKRPGQPSLIDAEQLAYERLEAIEHEAVMALGRAG
jgi:hypothetical protein